MTTQNELGQDKRLVCSLLPWLVAVAALVFYLLTFNSWVSLSNLSQVARASGYTHSANVYGPLYYVLTYPFGWLPSTWTPVAFNLFSLLCASLSLALLARSVALLPHDRTREQRMRVRNEFSLLSVGTAWIPPVLAVLLCGLTLTFWEGATNGGSDLLDMLLVAYCVRCLLEYRISKRESWMLRAALVWGAGMANGWLLFCLFPAFLVSIIWIRGFGFFNVRFLSRILFCGAAGMLLYLLLPLIQLFSAHSTISFWEALKLNLAFEKSTLLFFKQLPGSTMLLLVVSSFLPLVVIGIRWPSNIGDTSYIGRALGSWVFHVAHAAFLGVCIWVAFDPGFSPRVNGFPISALYYLAALSVGYLAGYFLLVFTPAPSRMRRHSAMQPWLNKLAHGLVWLLLLVVPAGFLYKNLPSIHVTNGQNLRNYATLLTRDLPAHAVVLSDNPTQLLLAEAAAAKSAKAGCIFLNSQALEQPSYYESQQKLYPEWPALTVTNVDKLDSVVLIRLMAKLSETHRIFYLHPSFGYYFEYFYPEQHGLISELKKYPTNSISGPETSQLELVENKKFWDENEPAFRSPPSLYCRPGCRRTLNIPATRDAHLSCALRTEFNGAPVGNVLLAGFECMGGSITTSRPVERR